MAVEIGKKIPKVVGVNQNGENIDFDQFIGKKLALFFYPKDDTPTCTNEVCNLRDNYNKLIAEGFTVVGISPDDVESHKKFIEKFKLPFDLIADTDLKICKKFGVWGQKQMFATKYMGVIRTTFIFNEKGKLIEIVKAVKSKEHHLQILKTQKLQKK